MAKNKKETSTEVKKEKKKTAVKKPVDLKGKTNTKTVSAKRSKATPAPRKMLTIVDNIAEKISKSIEKNQAIVDNDSHVNSNYVQTGDFKTPLSGTLTSVSMTGMTYIDGSTGFTNSSGNTAIVDIEKQPFTNPEFPDLWGSRAGTAGYIAPVKPKEDKFLTFLDSIESVLIELNSKLPLKENNVNSNNLDSLSYHELFEIKKHLADTINKHHYPGSTGNIYMMQAQRRYEKIEAEINNKLNILFGDV